MSRLDVHSIGKHTPLCPHKDRVRLDWMEKIPKHKDLVTISHGLLGMAQALRWSGRIQICDIDPGVRETTEYIRKNLHGGPGDYPDLVILPPEESIESAVRNYCSNFGIKKLGAVDVDLACSIRQAWDILAPVLFILIYHGYRGKVELTFRNGRRDGFGRNALDKRIGWLANKLPVAFQYVSHTPYQSTYVDGDASRHKGSAMCIVEIESRLR